MLDFMTAFLCDQVVTSCDALLTNVFTLSELRAKKEISYPSESWCHTA